MKQNQDLIEYFYEEIEKKGYKARIIDAKHIPDLKHDIQQQQVHMFPEFYEKYKKYFNFKPEVDFGNIESLIVIAVPVPQYEVTFQYKSNLISLMLPPTYLYGQKIIDELEESLKNIFNSKRYNVNYAYLPVKTLAVRSGLARYGRNNISYVSGMGSFYRLVPFYSDVPIEEDIWIERKMMENCENCNACVNKCPTGAIPTDRFLLRVDKCLTYHNEQPGEVPFPAWIDPSWHNCLVGCLHCQKICPVNKEVRDWKEFAINFNEEETQMILNEKIFDDLPIMLKEKIEQHDLGYLYEVIPRNLSVFLDQG